MRISLTQKIYGLILMAMMIIALPGVQTATAQPCPAPAPDAGTLSPKVPFNCSGLALVTLEATSDGNAIVPTGFQTLYLLTSGPNKVVRQQSSTPAFSVSGNNAYSIHSFVYDPVTFNAATIVLHSSTLNSINVQLIQGGGTICASLDLAGAAFTVQRPVAGALTAANAKECLDGGTAVVAATPDGNANVPYPFVRTFLLTEGPGLVVRQMGPNPSFNVSIGGSYTVHTFIYNPATFDITTVVPGVTTGVDILSQLIMGGGSICGVIDATGANTVVEDPAAGTITPDPAVCTNNLTATPDGNAVVPPGFQTVYLLSSGPGLVIIQMNANPAFLAPPSGQFTIHTFVYDPNTFDLANIDLGVTTGFDIEGMLVEGGGSICGSLDENGAKYNINVPYAGAITANNMSNCTGLALQNLEGIPDGNAYAPAGFQIVYLLTSGPNYIIRQMGPTPVFNVSGNNLYRIHTLVYDPATLDISTIVLHTTSALTVNATLVQGGGGICASLDLIGAQFTVQRPVAGTMTAVNASYCYDNNAVNLQATPDGNANVPYPFLQTYLLSYGASGTIVQIAASPSFSVSDTGIYAIHSFVYNPATFDLTTISLGVTTGADVFGQLVMGGGSICGSLDPVGAGFSIADPDAGTMDADNIIVCLLGGSATVSGTPNGDGAVPSGYDVAYLLTRGVATTIRQVSATPSFTVTQNGLYSIHTFVYDPTVFDITTVIPGSTSTLDVLQQLNSFGGTVCGDLDLVGALTIVLNQGLCLRAPQPAGNDGSYTAQQIEDLRLMMDTDEAGLSIVKTYPNPVSDRMQIELKSNHNEQIDVTVYNMMGQQVLHTSLSVMEGDGTYTLDVSNLVSGNYMIRLQSGSESASSTFMVR